MWYCNYVCIYNPKVGGVVSDYQESKIKVNLRKGVCLFNPKPDATAYEAMIICKLFTLATTHALVDYAAEVEKYGLERHFDLIE